MCEDGQAELSPSMADVRQKDWIATGMEWEVLHWAVLPCGGMGSSAGRRNWILLTQKAEAWRRD